MAKFGFCVKLLGGLLFGGGAIIQAPLHPLKKQNSFMFTLAKYSGLSPFFLRDILTWMGGFPPPPRTSHQFIECELSRPPRAGGLFGGVMNACVRIACACCVCIHVCSALWDVRGRAS